MNRPTIPCGQEFGKLGVPNPPPVPDVVLNVGFASHPQGEVFARRTGPHAHLVGPEPPPNPKPPTQSESLQASDSRHDKAFLLRMVEHFSRWLERE